MAYFDKYGVEFSDDRKTLINCPIGRNGSIGEYVIPDHVTIIGERAFDSCLGLTSISIPNSVTIIKEMAFSSCEKLKSIAIPRSVRKIEDCAFMNCIGLESITVDSNNRFYDSRQNCNAIIALFDTLIVGCKNTIIPNDIKKIDKYAFSGVPLTNIKIPDGVKAIEEGAFFGCTGLTTIKVPNSVVSIGYDAFAYVPNVLCDNPLWSMHYGTWAAKCVNGYADGWLVYNDITKTKIVACSSFAKGVIDLPNSVTSIEETAFVRCTGITEIRIPDSVTSIGRSAFSLCSSIARIKIPTSVTSIGTSAFYCVPNIEYHGSATGSPWDARCVNGYVEGGFVYKDATKTTLLSTVSMSGEIIVPDGVTHIGNRAFNSLGPISITLPNSIISINIFAFEECIENTQEIRVPFGQKARFLEMSSILSTYAYKVHECENTNNRLLKDDEKRHEEQRHHIEEQQLQEMLQNSILFFDTETTGTPRNYKAPVTDSYNWPRLVQLAWMMVDKDGNILKRKSVIVKPEGFSIPADAIAVHGITTERAQKEGLPLREVLEEFTTDLSFAERIAGHNVEFDRNIVGAELYRLGMDYAQLMDKTSTCTMKSSTDYCAIPNPNGYFGYKWPSLQELYYKLFNRNFEDAHDALADITATKECFFELRKRGIIGW